MAKISRNTNPTPVSVVGLGKLGLSYAAALASRNFKVIGIDINQQVLQQVSLGKATIFEPGLEELLVKYKNNLEVSDKHSLAIEKSDTTFILVATPSDSWQRFSNQQIELAIKSLAESLAESKKPYHLFVISSTTMPGSTQYRIIPLIERFSKRTLNAGFGVAFVPDFVSLGNVIHDYLNPDLVLIGQSDHKSGEIAENILKKLIVNNAPFVRMSLNEAELTKMALNCYITMKISFANSLANLCERIPGANVDNITQALGHDKRISPHYFRGGTGFGGTCFPRDTKAYLALAKKLGVQAEVIKAVDEVNNFQNRHVLDLIENYLPENDQTVAILGTAFKPGTPVIEESLASYLIPKLIAKNIKVTVYDPLANNQTKKIFGDEINYEDTAARCVNSSSVIVVANKDSSFRVISPNDFKAGAVIIDCWRLFDSTELIQRVNYVPIGVFSLF